MVAAENDEFFVDDFLSVLDELASQGGGRQGDRLAGVAPRHETWTEGEEAPRRRVDARRLVDLFADAQSLRPESAELYRTVYASVPSIGTLVEMALLRSDIPLRVGVMRLEKFLQMPAGAMSLTLGEGVRPRPRRRRGPEGPVGFLRRHPAGLRCDVGREPGTGRSGQLPRSSSSTGRASDPRERRPGGAGPAGAEGVRPARDVPRLPGGMADVVPAGAWSRWWTAARAVIRRSPLIEMSEGTQPAFFLRTGRWRSRPGPARTSTKRGTSARSSSWCSIT